MENQFLLALILGLVLSIIFSVGAFLLSSYLSKKELYKMYKEIWDYKKK
ncbi:hypothetical protein JEQ21_03535 [Streptococcus sp. 121]|nr:hypothetical protein [Streptococcus sp. 121]MBJ6745545.1 hypothetical protein [Streptococcus sp. 121]